MADHPPAPWPGEPPALPAEGLRALVSYLYAEHHALRVEIAGAIERAGTPDEESLELLRTYRLMALHLRELYDLDDPLWPPDGNP